jgi:predicted nucleotidyltransferase
MAESTLWGGKTLRQWLPVAVDDVVREVAPQRIVLFGSVARGDEGPDSDIDLLVVLDRLEPADREYERRKDVIGSMLYWPAREGQVVYERAT